MEVDNSSGDDSDGENVPVLQGLQTSAFYSPTSSDYEASETDYCFPDNSDDDDNASAWMSRHDVERIFRIPPKTYCKTSRTIYMQLENEEEVHSGQPKRCETCSSPTDDFFSACTQKCFEVRGREGENRSFFYLRQAFHRKPSTKSLR